MIMENELSPEIAAIAAKEVRRKRLDAAVQEVGEKYPELKEKIEAGPCRRRS